MKKKQVLKRIKKALDEIEDDEILYFYFDAFMVNGAAFEQVKEGQGEGNYFKDVGVELIKDHS